MAQRLSQEPQNERITAEEAEAVALAFANRERAKIEEESRLAETARASDLADLLGTTQSDVVDLLQKVRSDGRMDKVPSRPARQLPKTLMAATGAAVTVAVISYFVGYAVRGRQIIHSLLDIPPQERLSFDPYADAYRRPFNPIMLYDAATVVVDKTVAAPPQGLSVTLSTPREKEVIGGQPGPVIDSAASIAQLRRSIRSLLAYEESKMNVVSEVRLDDYSKMPWQATQDTYIGWHKVDVSNGRINVSGYLPDRRYATNIAGWEKAFNERLDWFCDKKLFASQHLFKLRPAAEEIKLSHPIPPGIELAAFDSVKTVYVDGGRWHELTSYDREAIQEQLRNSINEFQQAIWNRQLLPTASTQRGFSLMLVYPGGQTEGFWATSGQDVQEQHEQALQRLAGAAADALAKQGPLKPVGTEHIGGATPQATR